MEQNLPPLPKQPIGRTFTVAVSVLGIIALLQIIAVAIKIDWHRPTSMTTVAEASPTPTTPHARRPHRVLNTPGDISQASKEAAELVRQSAEKERAGDNEGALNLLEDADALMPNMPPVIAKMAELFEQMKQSQNALVQWRRLSDMGAAAGDYRKQAVAKLTSEAAISSGDAAGIRDDVGLQPGSTLGIVDCKMEDGKQGQKNLRIAIKSRPDSIIDANNDVVVHVFFYEKADGETTLTASRVTSKWLTETANWAEDGMQILSVQYPGPISGDSVGGDPHREYYGYMVAIYYKGLLQDFRTEPVRLRELFPPKVNLTPSP
ncbi:MAG: hypothetical protein ABIP97_07135 [Chthoniobacterales bacterium]